MGGVTSKSTSLWPFNKQNKSRNKSDVTQHSTTSGDNEQDLREKDIESDESNVIDEKSHRLIYIQGRPAIDERTPADETDGAKLGNNESIVDKDRSKADRSDPKVLNTNVNSRSMTEDTYTCSTIEPTESTDGLRAQPTRPNSVPLGERSDEFRAQPVRPKSVASSNKTSQRKKPRLKASDHDHNDDGPPQPREFLKDNGATNHQSSPRGSRHSQLSDIPETDSHVMSNIYDRDHMLELEKKDEEIKELMETIQNMANAMDKHRMKSFRSTNKYDWSKDEEIRSLKARLRESEFEKETLVTRLSAAVGTKLTHNNPAIADLSDGNRPTKLAEKYSELYDNDWTDAYTTLEVACAADVIAKHKADLDVDKEIVYGLVKVLTITYTICRKESEMDMAELNKLLRQIYCEAPTLDLQKQLTDKRKQTYKTGADRMRTKVNERVHCFLTKQWTLRTIPEVTDRAKVYIDKCRELCWLMVIQDPPVYMDCDIVDKCLNKKKKSFRKDLYKEYTKSGEKTEFIVWPALYLHESGPILCKGVAQGKHSKNKKGNRSVRNVLDLPKANGNNWTVEGDEYMARNATGVEPYTSAKVPGFVGDSNMTETKGKTGSGVPSSSMIVTDAISPNGKGEQNTYSSIPIID